MATDTPSADKTTSDSDLKIKSSEEKILREGGGVTFQLLFAVVVIAFGSSFQFGYNIGAINAPGDLIQVWMGQEHERQFGHKLNPDHLTLIFSAAVALFAVGAMIGAIACGWLADKFGRRTSLHVNNVLSILAATLMTVPKFVHFYPLFHLGRFIVGINAGIASGVVPLYMTELSPIRLRGSFGSVPQLVVTISILISQVMGLPAVLGTEDRWPYIFAILVVPSIFQIGCLFFVPESPKYTMMFSEDRDKAFNDLMSLRGANQELVEAELSHLEIEKRKGERLDKVSVLSLFRREYRWPLFLAVFLMAAQQLSGINAAMFYSTEIFRQAGLKGTQAIYATIGMGSVNVLTTILSLWLVDHPRFGRRSLLLIGKIGMIVASVCLVATIYCFTRGIAKSVTPYLACGFLPLFVFFFATGPGSIPFFYVSEIFGSSARASASAVSACANWGFNFVVGLSFLPINNILHEFTFLIFSVVCLFAAIFIVIYLPETKGKTLEEVQEELDAKKPACC